MSDADKPWSSPSAGSSSGSASPLSSIAPKSTVTPMPQIKGHDDLRASLALAAENFRRKQEASEEHGQSQGQSASPAAMNPAQKSTSLQDEGPIAPDMSEMTKNFDALFAKREEERNELARRKGEEEFQEGAGRIMRGAIQREAGMARMQAGIDNAEGVAFASGAHAHHAEDLRGWAEAARAATAGAYQHETEENRGRSSGMSV